MTIYGVTKTIITVTGPAHSHYLMSYKCDPLSNNEGKLEFLGGRMEDGEAPVAALLRELGEEEQTGILAHLAQARLAAFTKRLFGTAQHYLFHLNISLEEFSQLAHDPSESHGFELVSGQQLHTAELDFTRKTKKIIAMLAEAQESSDSVLRVPN